MPNLAQITATKLLGCEDFEYGGFDLKLWHCSKLIFTLCFTY